MYQLIRDNFPPLLGTAVPSLIDAGMLSDGVEVYRATPTLATQLVGQCLNHDPRGLLSFLNNHTHKSVSSEDERGIYRAALKSLGDLHRKKHISWRHCIEKYTCTAGRYFRGCLEGVDRFGKGN